MPYDPPKAATVSTETLRSLHRLHRQLTDLRQRLELGPKRVQAAQGATAQRERELAETQAELKRLRIAADQKQLQLKASEDKIKDLDRKLLACQSNREYQILRDQIAADRMANDVLSDEILEALEGVDQMQKNVAEMEANVKSAKARLAEVTGQQQAEEPSIRGDLERVEAELRQAETGLPADVAEYYQRVVRQKGKDGLAAVEGEVCGGCHQMVPVNIRSQILMGRPSFCKTCGRLLYMPEEK